MLRVQPKKRQKKKKKKVGGRVLQLQWKNIPRVSFLPEPVAMESFTDPVPPPWGGLSPGRVCLEGGDIQTQAVGLCRRRGCDLARERSGRQSGLWKKPAVRHTCREHTCPSE